MHTTHSEVRWISQVLVEINVEVPWEHVKHHLEETFNGMQKHAKIRGFRPGKVPKDLVRKLFQEQVRRDVGATLLDEGLRAAFKEHALLPVVPPQVEVPAVVEGETLTFSAQVEVQPKLEQIKLEGLKLTRPQIEITDAQVEEELKRLQNQNAELVTVEPLRPAQAGDTITFDYTARIDGQERPDISAKGQQLELGTPNAVAEFDQALIGSEIGQVKEVTIQFPQQHSREELRGKHGTFLLTVQQIQKKVLPDLDDEFAKDLGEYKNLEELKKEVFTRLETSAKGQVDFGLREQAIDKIIEANPMELPPSLLAQEKNHTLRELVAYAQMTGAGFPEKDDLESTVQHQAERKLRAGLLMVAVAKQANLSVQTDDLENYYTEIATRSGIQIAKLRAQYQKPERREQLLSQLLEQKIFAYIFSQVTIEDASPESQDKQSKKKKSRAQVQNSP